MPCPSQQLSFGSDRTSREYADSVAGPAGHKPGLSDRIADFLESTVLPTPLLVIDVAAVASKYLELQRTLPEAVIYYAVKANPLPQIVRSLAETGSGFDVSSAAEIEQCLAIGVSPAQLSFGNTIKKASVVARAHAEGIKLFSFDSAGELEKIAANAPGARVTVRLLSDGRGADWPLSRKFGCEPAMAFDLLLRARDLGLVPYGIGFHVGSQQTDPRQWDEPIALSAELGRCLWRRGIRLQSLNIGGGFPAQYTSVVPSIASYGAAIERALFDNFGRHRPQIVVEPGRYLVADAGVIETEIILISQKSYADHRRWVYLDCGKFGGLAETMGEAIKYRLRTPTRSARLMPVILAGPTCDSADILYQNTVYYLPTDLREGDRIQILSAGAYTYTYSSVGFNGFPPLRAVCI
jgi:ornithine decarboxylase